MWPLPKIRDETVSIVYTPQAITCSWITCHKKRTPYTLQAVQTTMLSKNSTNTAYLHNPTKLKKIIRAFLIRHNLENAFIAMSTTGTGVVQQIVSLPTASPTPEHFTHPSLKNCIWDFCYLYPNSNAQSTFYVCGIQRELLAQYQLLSIAAHLNLVMLTTPLTTLLAVYKKIYGAAFRHSQLTRDMERYNNKLDNVFTIDTIKQLIYVPSHIVLDKEHEKNTLLTALGLFLLGK